MKAITLLLIGLIGLGNVPGLAQKIVPHSFRYQAGPRQAGPRQADTSGRDTSGRTQLRFLTQVTQPNTTFLRLYFAGTQLGENSYLVLEGTEGTRQELRKQDLENWHYSSAYFNGQSVNVSLFAAPGDRNMIIVSGIKVSDTSASPTKNARQAAQAQPSARQSVAASVASSVTYPYAKAVGRFTNGSDSYGTGWIAPNGAIVTSYYIYVNYIKNQSYDVIEFDVPPSVGTTVQHPSPENQYPLSAASDQIKYGQTIVPFKGTSILLGRMNTYAILNPLANSTGFRPGERQQEYFRISTNPKSSDIKDAGNVPVDILHYGSYPGDSYVGGFRTLHLYPTSLLEQNEYLSVFAGSERNEFVIYNGVGLVNGGASGTIGSDTGGPITYGESNIAMGLHEAGSSDTESPSTGIGFRNDGFRNDLARFFTAQSAYVDLDGLNNSPTGEINKTYLTVQQAAQHAPNDYTVYIAKGAYPGAVTFNRPLTLRAPVGKVVIGSANGGGRRVAQPSIVHDVAMAEAFGGQSRLEGYETAEKVRAFPNPFREQTEIKHPFTEGGPVSVDILNTAGVSVATFNLSNVATGQNRVQWNGTDQAGRPVPTGLYIIKVNDGRQTFTTKVLKQ